MPRRRRRREKKNSIFFSLIFSTFSTFFLKNNLAKFWKFWEFFAFFLFTMVSIGKVYFSAKCPYGRIGGLKNFWGKKNMDARFEIFHIFYAKKRLLFSIFGPPLFLGRVPEKKIGISLKFLHQKKINRFGPPPPFRFTWKLLLFWKVTLPSGSPKWCKHRTWAHDLN